MSNISIGGYMQSSLGGYGAAFGTRYGGSYAKASGDGAVGMAGDPNTANRSTSALPGVDGSSASQKADNNKRCRTCEERSYMDGSNDPGVSMKSPTKLDPSGAASAVMAHEREHVFRNAAEAKSEDRVVLSSSITLHSDICPECGKTYISGGTTRTVTANDTNKQQSDRQQSDDERRLDIRA